MEDKRYYITKDQYDSLVHLKRMFEYQAERVHALCQTERGDIEYGFELGQIYAALRDNFVDAMNLESEIYEQKIQQNDEKPI